MAWSFSMDTVLDLVGAKTRGKVTRAGEIEVQCPHGVCGRNKQPVYFSVNVAKGQYNCFHCCSGCPYSGGMIDLYCMFTGIDPNDRQFAKHAISMDLSGKPAHTKCKIVMRPESDIDLSLQARPDAELDKVYRAVLNELTLNPEHRENLRKRGLTDEVIDRCLYRSVPEHWAGVFVRLKKQKVSFIGIPGFYEKNGKANTCEAELLGIKVLNTEVGSFDASISTAGPLQAIESKLNQAEEKDNEKEEDQKDGQTSQDSSASSSANKYADDYNYADFCGRLYIPAAGIDVALYNNTWQETCNRSDSAAIFPHRPEDGGSNIVADNELETLTSVSVGSTAYVITPSGQQINYVCVDAFDGHNDVTGYDALQKDDGTIVWGSAELIVYTCLGDSYNVRVACFNRA